MARQKVPKDADLRIFNATLSHHPDDMVGMAFHHIIPDEPHIYEIALPRQYVTARRAGV
jgi:hypothetical protein